jgi:hypothetical protein
MPALRALGCRQQARCLTHGRAIGAARPRRVPVGGGDVGRQRGHRQSIGGHRDSRVNFTPANLVSHFHRSLEAETTTRVLRAVFADKTHFAVHEPLPASPQFGDEGAANHTRLAGAGGEARRRAFRLRPRGVRHESAAESGRFPAPADSREACEGDRAPARPRPGAYGVRAAVTGGDRGVGFS